MTEIAIRTEELTRDFDTVRAVDHLSLEVPGGIIFGFLGPNGAGKTTTIRLLLGLLEPTGGQAEVLGCDVRTQSDRIRERSGALLEHSGLYERLTAEDNLDYYGRIWHIPRQERKSRIQELLTRFGLWERRSEIVKEWSRGMKQKLAVARALLHRPSLVFLDEPTAGLDPMASAALREDLASLAEREGVTVFLNTHQLADAEKLCHQVGIIREGQLLAVGPLDTLRARTKGPRVVITGGGFTEEILSSLRARPEIANVATQDGQLSIDLDGESAAAPLIRLLVEAGADVEEVHRSKATLEEVFMTLMEEETC